MKKLSTIFIGTLLTFSVAQAEGMEHDGEKCGGCEGSMKVEKSDYRLLNDSYKKDGYTIALKSKKSLVVGNNDIEVTLQKDSKNITDAKVKIKFFMPEMPGMPYMEYKDKLKLDNGVYKGSVNLSMSGTWQYHLKFKSVDGSVHKVRGSLNI